MLNDNPTLVHDSQQYLKWSTEDIFCGIWQNPPMSLSLPKIWNIFDYSTTHMQSNQPVYPRNTIFLFKVFYTVFVLGLCKLNIFILNAIKNENYAHG